MIGHYPSRGDFAVAPASRGPSLRGFDRATRPRHDDHQGHSHCDGSSVRLLLEGDGHLALWNARRQMGDWAFRRVFGHRLVLPR